MGDRAYEKVIFRALLEADRAFLGEELADWAQPPDERDFPDVIGTTASGRRIGVELGEWLNEAEIAASKRTQKAQDAMLAVIGAQGANTTAHVGSVWLLRRTGAAVRPEDEGSFREQLFTCIQTCDADDNLWRSPAGYFVASSELSAYPTLARYLNGLTLHRRDRGECWPEGIAWIRFPSRGGAYSADTMLQPLLRLVDKKRGHYPRGRSGFHHLSLVVFYNRAVLHNSPVETLDFKFEDAVRLARDTISRDSGPFDSAFVFDATASDRLFRIHP